MVKTNFTLSQSIVLSIVFFNIMAVSRLPGIVYSERINYLIQIIVFFLVSFMNLNPEGLLKFKGLKFDLINSISLVIILSFILSSFYFNLNNNLDILSIAKLITYPIIIYYFFNYLPRIIYHDKDLFELILNYWLYFSLISIFVSLGVLLLGLDIFQYTANSTVGYFYYTNIFAFIFTFTIPILLYKYFTKQLSFLPFLFFLLPSLVCLLFTYSRAGYIGALLSLIVLIYKKSRLLFIVTLIFLTVVSSTIVFQFASAKGSASAFSRVQVMVTGYDMIFNHGLKNFLWGYGVLNSKKVFVQELTSNFDISREETGPHNFILTLGIQFGMILTFSLLLYIIILFVKSQSKAKRNYFSQRYFKVNLAIAITAGIIVECILEDVVVYPEFFVMPMFLLFLGYLKYYINDNTVESNEEAS